MAVQFDIDDVRDAVESELFARAEKLLDSGGLGEFAPFGGGVTCLVPNGTGPGYEVWVGVVAKALTGECDCPAAEADPDELCLHAVALTIGALDADFVWSSSATPPSQASISPKVRQLAEIAATVPARRLVMLVAEHAANDRRLETRLLTYAGRLGAATERELANVRATIDSLAGDAVRGEYDLHDVARAGQLIVDELEILAQRPATVEALALVEHAAEVWDELAAILSQAYETYETESEEIGGALRAVHVRMCEELEVDPDDLIDRLIGIISGADYTSCLDAPGDYLALLGPDGVAAVNRRR